MSQTKGVAHFGRPSAAAPRCTFPPPFTLKDPKWRAGYHSQINFRAFTKPDK